MSLCWLAFCLILLMGGLSDTPSKKDVSIEFFIFNFPIFILIFLNLFKLKKINQKFSIAMMALVFILNLGVGTYQNHWKRWNVFVEQKYEIVGRSVYFASLRKPKIDAATFKKVTIDKRFNTYTTFLYQDKSFLYIDGDTLKDLPIGSFKYHTPYYYSLSESLFYLPKGNDSKYDFSKKVEVLSEGVSDVEFIGASCFKKGNQHYIGNRSINLPSDFRWLKKDKAYTCHYGASTGKIWSFKFKEGRWRSRHPKTESYSYTGDLETTALLSEEGDVHDRDNHFRLNTGQEMYQKISE